MQTRTVAIAIDDENEYRGVAEGRRIRCAPCSRYLRGTGSEIVLFAKQTDGRALHANLSHVGDPIARYSILSLCNSIYLENRRLSDTYAYRFRIN